MRATCTTRGFTMLETLMVIAVFSLLSIILVNLFLNFGGFYTSQQANIDVVQSANRLMRDIEVATLVADSVEISHFFSSGTQSTDADSLVLRLPAINASGDPIAASYDYVAFYASGTAAYRVQEPSGSSARQSEASEYRDVAALSFMYNASSTTDVSSVDVMIRTEATEDGRVLQTELVQLVHLRNKP